MARRLIGTAVTDSNGEATITYTGTGAGKLNVVAESGTFLTKTYSVNDCVFYDKGTSGTPNPKWRKFSNSSTISSTSNGLTLSSGASDSEYFTPNPTNVSSSSYADFTIWDNFCVEFNVKGRVGGSASYSSDTQFQLRKTTGTTENVVIIDDMIGKHIKVTYSNSTMNIWIDGQAQTPITIGGNVMVRFYCASGSKSLTITDFEFYPI